MRVVGNYRGARPIGFAFVAGLVAFEIALAFGAGQVGIPGILVVRFGQGSGDAAPTVAQEGGESVIAKLPVTSSEAKQTTPLESPTNPAASDAAEPRFAGLADIPLDVLDRPKPQGGEADAVDASAGGREALPWDAVEPVPFSPDGPKDAAPEATAAVPKPVQAAVGAAPRPSVTFQLPAGQTIESWVKAKAVEIKGNDRERPLYHFEFWLDAPDDVKHRLVAVVYEFNTPAVMPQSQVSREQKTGFRVSAGGLTCADKVTITLKFSDGQSQQIAVDGCRLLS